MSCIMHGASTNRLDVEQHHVALLLCSVVNISRANSEDLIQGAVMGREDSSRRAASRTVIGQNETHPRQISI